MCVSLVLLMTVVTLGIGVCEGVGRDSGCGHEDSHLMHDTENSIYDCIIYMEYDLMFYVCHCMCI